VIINWPKLIVYGLFVAAMLALPIGWYIDHSHAEARYAVLTSSYTLAKSANESNQSTIKDLKAANERLAKAQKAQLDAALKAATRIDQLRAALNQQVEDNVALRRKMAQENPDVASYLSGGMPCELAQQLWGKQAGYCSD
jgi:hypothetical protein